MSSCGFLKACDLKVLSRLTEELLFKFWYYDIFTINFNAYAFRVRDLEPVILLRSYWHLRVVFESPL
jgi:hypothetical protein